MAKRQHDRVIGIVRALEARAARAQFCGDYGRSAGLYRLALMVLDGAVPPGVEDTLETFCRAGSAQGQSMDEPSSMATPLACARSSTSMDTGGEEPSPGGGPSGSMH